MTCSSLRSRALCAGACACVALGRVLVRAAESEAAAAAPAARSWLLAARGGPSPRQTRWRVLPPDIPLQAAPPARSSPPLRLRLRSPLVVCNSPGDHALHARAVAQPAGSWASSVAPSSPPRTRVQGSLFGPPGCRTCVAARGRTPARQPPQSRGPCAAKSLRRAPRSAHHTNAPQRLRFASQRHLSAPLHSRPKQRDAPILGALHG